MAIIGLAISVDALSSGTIARLNTGGAPFWGNAANIGDTFSKDPWDTLWLGGTQLPGICEVKGVTECEVDKKKVKNSNGARLTVTGYNPRPFDISVTVWTANQWNALQDFINRFWIQARDERPEFTSKTKRNGSNPDGTPKTENVSVKNKTPRVAISIAHPAAASVGITSCVLQSVSIPEATNGGDFRVVKFKAVEHLEPGHTVTKSSKATSSGDIPLAARLGKKAKGDIPDKPSTTREDLGPKGVRAAAASGSD